MVGPRRNPGCAPRLGPAQFTPAPDRVELTPDEFGVLASVERAVKSEREACAALAEEHGFHFLAGRIREREDKPAVLSETDQLAARLDTLEQRIDALEGKD